MTTAVGILAGMVGGLAVMLVLTLRMLGAAFGVHTELEQRLGQRSAELQSVLGWQHTMLTRLRALLVELACDGELPKEAWDRFADWASDCDAELPRIVFGQNQDSAGLDDLVREATTPLEREQRLARAVDAIFDESDEED